MAVVTNVLTNPSFELDAAGWTPTPSTQAMALPGVGAGSTSAWTALTPISATFPASAGQDWTGSGWFMVSSVSTTRTAAVSVRFFDSGGTELDAPTVTLTSLPPSSVPERRSQTRTAPTGTASVALRYHVNNSSFALHVDALMLTQTSTLEDYFDGDTTDGGGYSYAWTGTPHASSSTRTEDTGPTPTADPAVDVEATVTTTLSTLHTRSAPADVAATVSTVLSAHHNLSVPVGVEVTATTEVAAGGAVEPPLDTETTVSTTLSTHHTLGVPVSVDTTASSALSSHHTITVPVGLTATVSTVLDNDQPELIGAAASVSVTVTTQLVTNPRISVSITVEGVTYTELGYVVAPAELGTTPLGKLLSFSVSTAAVPVNPADGSNSTPSVNAGYVRGPDAEFALGETNVISHGTVGTYEGEIVSLRLPEASGVASVSQDTLLTRLGTEMRLFPFIDAAPSVWTAPRAIDYWTQQCGVFYDKVPGDCIAYASGYGHTDSYGAQTTARFYEKLVGGTPNTTVLNNRSVRTLGSAVTGTTAFHELKDGAVAVSVPQNRKLVASIGLGIRGTGRTSTATWNISDPKDVPYNISISATSAGLVTASLGGVLVDSATVASDANYRLTFSIEKMSATAVVGKLTVHTDDLAGTGALAYDGSPVVATYSLPLVAHLNSITHVSSGGTGSEMLRWGTYLTVATEHPMQLPATQKVLEPTTKTFEFVSGFEGNVWGMLGEFCAITRLDVAFLGAQLVVSSRLSALAAPRGNFSRLGIDSERREKYRQVAVVNKHSRAVSTDDAVLWRADSVFQVAAREVFETTVQTGHSILSVVQPVVVDAIWPFPYTTGAGQYVVTGADGYIIAPAWWNDNGGKVEVSLTGKEGEIAIKITAPAIDTVRAPYRISEGEADRPALYVAGSGILNDPKEVVVGTGAKNAREGYDSVFESPFIAGTRETYDTAAAMAAEYSASVADASFEIPNDFYTPSRFGQYPAGQRFTDGKRVYRITSASQTHSKVSGNAVPHTTIGDYVASYPAGATIVDEMARHAGRTIKQFNIKPLRSNDEQA